MENLIRLAALILVKMISHVFYRFDIDWVASPESNFSKARIGILLNHTSLFDILFLGVLPLSTLWRIARIGTFPVADITIGRPILGRFVRFLAANAVSITRTRDDTWDLFLKRATPQSLILIAPEGRMRRPNGFDKHGNAMTVRGGLADLLWSIEGGKMILLYSGGLHHVQAPGERIPRIFKRVRARFEAIEIDHYKNTLGEGLDRRAFKLAVTRDMERRRDRFLSELTP